jgi:Fe-S cluster assembly iron-binding protein IscA
VLTLSPSAVQAVDTLLHSIPEATDDAGLRIATDGESHLTITIAAEPAPGDQVIEDGGARVFVDAGAAPALDNVQLDARQEGDQIAFALTTAEVDPAAMQSNNGNRLPDEL